jgi:hypothetical protein
MQPTYLPWCGYFNIINSVDIFIFLDDAQYSKGSWHNRNRILNKCKETWITIPIKRHKLNSNINEINFDYEKDWKNQHINLIKECYQKHPFYSDVEQILTFLKSSQHNILSEFNMDLIKFICNKLLFKTLFYKSSDFKIKEKKRTDKIINLLENFNITHYVSPQGSKDYLLEDNFFGKTNINLEFNNYTPDKYYQNFNKNSFFNKLSVIDVLSNLGWDMTKKYICSNFLEMI